MSLKSIEPLSALSTYQHNPLAGLLPDISQQCLDDACWTHIFLPMLTHAFYISTQPFADWTWCSSNFFETVQKVFDLSFTNVSYTLRQEDSLVKVVCPIWSLSCQLSLIFFGRPMTEWRLRSQSLPFKSWPSWRHFSMVLSSGTDQRGLGSMLSGHCGQVGQCTTKTLFPFHASFEQTIQVIQWVFFITRDSC